MVENNFPKGGKHLPQEMNDTFSPSYFLPLIHPSIFIHILPFHARNQTKIDLPVTTVFSLVIS